MMTERGTAPAQSPAPGQPTRRIAGIVALVAQDFGIAAPIILSERRDRDVVLARWAAMWLAYHLTGCSSPRIGHALNRDHTSVLHGYRQIETRLARDHDLRRRLEGLEVRAIAQGLVARAPRETTAGIWAEVRAEWRANVGRVADGEMQ